MHLANARNQPALTQIFSFDGTITSGGTAQLLLPQQPTRCYFFIQNLASQILTVGVGPAKATAALTNGAVSSVSVANAGVGYTIPPKVMFFGGVVSGDLSTVPGKPQNGRVAQAVASLTGSALNAITVSDGGAGYVVAPDVLLYNPVPDLGGGAFLPSATAGITLQQYGTLVFENSFVPTDAVAVFGATTSNAFVCKVAF